MESLPSILKHPDELYPLAMLKLAMMCAEKQIPTEPAHWRFCYSMLDKAPVSPLVITQSLDTEISNVICVFYLVLRALDTIEDDTSIAAEAKVPLLQSFHRHMYNRKWRFVCGKDHDKVLMKEFHQVSTAFLELDRRYQEVIEDTTMRMGAGMAKFIDKEITTLDDYDEYCHIVAGLVVIGVSRVLQAHGRDNVPSDDLCNELAVFIQKYDIITDYLEDINEMPKSRIFWPHQIWGKYVDQLEDLKDEENSAKALICLNEMVTNALVHVEDCLKFISDLGDLVCAYYLLIGMVITFGTLALCYDNIKVFKGGVIMRPGVIAKLFCKIRTMSDVYEAVYHYSLIIKSKVNDNDPNARRTRDLLDTIMKICKDSGTLTKGEILRYLE